MSELLPRGITDRIVKALGSVPCVVLEGPRACGKSTLGRQLQANGHLATIIDLADPTARTAAERSPSTFIDNVALPALIDEAQLVPELTLAVKQRVDLDGAPGQFVLTGSSRLGRTALGGSDPLAGRAVRLGLRPMTQGELVGHPVNLVARLLAGDAHQLGAFPPLTTADLVQRARRGGLPVLAGVTADISDDIRSMLYSEYVEGVLHHEVDRRIDRAETARLLRHLAASTGRLLNITTVANDLASTRDTVRSRLAQLVSTFLLHELLGHRPAEHRVLTTHPKLHVVDVGLAAWACRVTDELPSAAVVGALVETLVVNEIVTQAMWTPLDIAVRHWRDTARKVEVDAVLIEGGRTLPIEVKAARDVRDDDLAGLRRYLDTVPSADTGVVFYAGGVVLQLDDRIWAVPISALWSRSVHGEFG